MVLYFFDTAKYFLKMYFLLLSIALFLSTLILEEIREF